MSEWGRLQDALHDEFDRQGVEGVDVDKVIEHIVNLRGFFPGLLGAAPHDWQDISDAESDLPMEGAAPLDPLLPDTEVAETLRKLARQHHGIAGHRDGSWTYCYDRWCRDAMAVLDGSEGAAPRAEGLDVERLLEVAMTARRMVEDGHPDSPEWFRIMSERLSTVMDLTDAALMDGVDAVVARLSRPSDERVPESEEPR